MFSPLLSSPTIMVSTASPKEEEPVRRSKEGSLNFRLLNRKKGRAETEAAESGERVLVRNQSTAVLRSETLIHRKRTATSQDPEIASY